MRNVHWINDEANVQRRKLPINLQENLYARKKYTNNGFFFLKIDNKRTFIFYWFLSDIHTIYSTYSKQTDRTEKNKQIERLSIEQQPNQNAICHAWMGRRKYLFNKIWWAPVFSFYIWIMNNGANWTCVRCFFLHVSIHISFNISIMKHQL